MEHIDLENAIDTGELVNGTIVDAGTNKETLEDYVIVDVDKYLVYIRGDEITRPPFSGALTSLIGKNVQVIITDKEDTDEGVTLYSGSMKKASDILQAPIVEKLLAGEHLKGVVTKAFHYGVWIKIETVYVFMRNMDFADDGTAVWDKYNRGDSIVVRFVKKRPSDGVILVGPVKKIKGEKLIRKKMLVRGDAYPGRITNAYPHQFYVKIANSVDVVCPPPRNIFGLKSGEEVYVKIKHIGKNSPENRTLGIIVQRLI